MGFFSNLIRNAVDDGISKGIRNAVGKATEKIVAPHAENYANKVADTLDEATNAMDAANAASSDSSAQPAAAPSSLEQSLDRMSKSLERYAANMEKAVAPKEEFLKDWEAKVPKFPVWCFGGTDMFLAEIENTDEDVAYSLNVENTTQEALDAYVAILKENGFEPVHEGWEDLLVKELENGECLGFGKTDAFGTAPVMSVNLARAKSRKYFE